MQSCSGVDTTPRIFVLRRQADVRGRVGRCSNAPTPCCAKLSPAAIRPPPPPHCVLFLQAIGPSSALDTSDESFLQGYGHVGGTMGGGSDKGLNVTRGAIRSGAGAVGKVRRSLAACWPLPRQTRASFGAQKQHFGFIQQDHEASHGGKPRRPSRTNTWLRGDPGRGEGELSDAVVNQSGPRVADHVELSVAVVEVQRDGSARRCRAAPDLGDVKFDAGGEINPYPVLFTGRGADDGAASRTQVHPESRLLPCVARCRS